MDPAVADADRMRNSAPHRIEQKREHNKAWREKNTEAWRAHAASFRAIRDGILKREPCLFCGRADVHAHHRDYSKPLQVIWLCPKCHSRLHAYFPETEGSNKFSPKDAS